MIGALQSRGDQPPQAGPIGLSVLLRAMACRRRMGGRIGQILRASAQRIAQPPQLVRRTYLPCDLHYQILKYVLEVCSRLTAGNQGSRAPASSAHAFPLTPNPAI